MNQAQLQSLCGVRVEPRDIEGVGRVFFRSPKFAEWYIVLQKQRENEGHMLPAETIALTIAAVLSDENGNRLYDDEHASELLNMPPRAVMHLYEEAKKTLSMSDESVAAASGN